MEKEVIFGEVTLDQLINANKTVAKVLEFVQENRNSADEDKKELARVAFMALLLDDMFKHRTIMNIVENEVDAHEAEKKAEGSNPSFSIHVRPSSDKS